MHSKVQRPPQPVRLEEPHYTEREIRQRYKRFYDRAVADGATPRFARTIACAAVKPMREARERRRIENRRAGGTLRLTKREVQQLYRAFYKRTLALGVSEQFARATAKHGTAWARRCMR